MSVWECMVKWVHGYVGRWVGMLVGEYFGICVAMWVSGYMVM